MKPCRKCSVPTTGRLCYACKRDANLKARYGISAAEYAMLWKSRDGRCDICKRQKSLPTVETKARDMLVVDHVKGTGEIRGLLCQDCNNALGVLGDNENGLLRAFEYVAGWNPLEELEELRSENDKELLEWRANLTPNHEG